MGAKNAQVNRQQRILQTVRVRNWIFYILSMEIPYSGKFLRGPIFAVFVVDWQTTKIKPVK